MKYDNTRIDIEYLNICLESDIKQIKEDLDSLEFGVGIFPTSKNNIRVILNLERQVDGGVNPMKGHLTLKPKEEGDLVFYKDLETVFKKGFKISFWPGDSSEAEHIVLSKGLQKDSYGVIKLYTGR